MTECYQLTCTSPVCLVQCDFKVRFKVSMCNVNNNSKEQVKKPGMQSVQRRLGLVEWRVISEMEIYDN